MVLFAGSELAHGAELRSLMARLLCAAERGCHTPGYRVADRLCGRGRKGRSQCHGPCSSRGFAAAASMPATEILPELRPEPDNWRVPSAAASTLACRSCPLCRTHAAQTVASHTAWSLVRMPLPCKHCAQVPGALIRPAMAPAQRLGHRSGHARWGLARGLSARPRSARRSKITESMRA